MTRLHPWRRRALPIGASTVAATLAVLALTVSGSASAHDGRARAVPAPPAVPSSADQIQNIDQVKTAIKGYYGDTVTTDVDPVPNDLDGGDKILHTFSPTSPYANEMGGIVHSAEKFLAKPKGHHGSAHHPTATRAVLFDVDDTTLNTYNYEIYSNFVYVPAQNAAFVNSAAFPAVPHMVGLEQYAIAH